MTGQAAVSRDEFARAMAAFAPFETAPEIAAGVSGGADSLALALLLHDWARGQGGRLVALTVDHGLRPGSRAEARRVGALLAGQGIEQRILTWRGPKPAAGVQAAARAARYDLLAGWCARHGLLHLATGHHLDDQAETLLLRLARGSGLDGLAGMPAQAGFDALRLLRPLLAFPKARLEATVAARSLGWIEDPSNRDPAFDRTKVRRLLSRPEGLGFSAPRLAATAGHLGRAREAAEREVARLLARSARLDPAGFARLDPEPLAGASRETALRALARLLTVVGGGAYAPRFERLERLFGRLAGGLGRGATLGGCRIVPRRGGLLIVREAARAPTLPIAPGTTLRWDDRFEITLGRGSAGPLTLGPLGPEGWSRIAERVGPGPAGLVPPPARAALPALRQGEAPLAVPHLGYRDPGLGPKVIAACRFSPRHPLAGTSFTVA